MYGVSSQDPLWDPTGGGAGLSLREIHGQTQPSSPRAALKGTLMDGEMTSHLIGVTWSDGEGGTPKSNPQNNSGSPKSHSARPLFLAQEVLRRVGRVSQGGLPNGSDVQGTRMPSPVMLTLLASTSCQGNEEDNTASPFHLLPVLSPSIPQPKPLMGLLPNASSCARHTEAKQTKSKCQSLKQRKIYYRALQGEWVACAQKTPELLEDFSKAFLKTRRGRGMPGYVIS